MFLVQRYEKGEKWVGQKKVKRRFYLFTFLLLSAVEHRSEGTFAIEELFGFILDTQLSDHIKVIIATLHTEPSVLHADEGNAGNQ